MSVSAPTPLINISCYSKNGSHLASGFRTLIAEVHEQCQDCLNQAKNELEPLEFVHDITPSLSERRAGYLQPAALSVIIPS